MSIITKASAKNYFLTGLFPTQLQFADTIDSYIGLGESALQTMNSPLTINGAFSVSGNAAFTGGTVTVSGNSVLVAPVANASLATMAANTVKVNATGSIATPTDLALAANTLLGMGSSGNIAQITLGTGMSMASAVLNGPTVIAASPITNTIASDVNLNNTSNFFDGPSIAQGSSGTWFVSGSVTVLDSATTSTYVAKLWDGTTVIDSVVATIAGAASYGQMSLSGYIVGPVGNLRISVRDISANTGKIIKNDSGAGKDSTISAIRIA